MCSGSSVFLKSWSLMKTFHIWFSGKWALCHSIPPFPFWSFPFFSSHSYFLFVLCTIRAIIGNYYAWSVWCNCITVRHIHQIWLRSSVFDCSLLMRSRPAEFVGGSVKSSAEEARIQLVSFLLRLRTLQIFGSRRRVLTLWARRFVAVFPDLTTTKWNGLSFKSTL